MPICMKNDKVWAMGLFVSLPWSLAWGEDDGSGCVLPGQPLLSSKLASELLWASLQHISYHAGIDWFRQLAGDQRKRGYPSCKELWYLIRSMEKTRLLCSLLQLQQIRLAVLPSFHPSARYFFVSGDGVSMTHKKRSAIVHMTDVSESMSAVNVNCRQFN